MSDVQDDENSLDESQSQYQSNWDDDDSQSTSTLPSMQRDIPKHQQHSEEYQEPDRAAAEQMLRDQYLTKAKAAYVEKNYKMCLMFMKGMPLSTREIVTLMVEAAYNMWLSIPSELNNEKFGKTKEQQEILDTVKNSFTALLAEKSSKHLVTAYEYIRLSHIYLAEGALSGALQILQLASARGHLENTLVVLQALTILTRLKMHREIENHVTFLLTDITLESRDREAEVTLSGGFSCKEWSLKSPSPGLYQRVATPVVRKLVMVQNSPLPLAFVYLHCACYLKRRATQTLKKEEQTAHMELCIHTIAEAYQLYTHEKPPGYVQLTQWFSNGHLFFEMAEYLETTPFVLLAEDSYWEAFLRLQLYDLPLERTVRCMRLTKRGHREYIKDTLARAFATNRWNFYARKQLLDVENLECVMAKSTAPVYGPRFQDEEDIAEVIQGIWRSKHLRKFRWVDIYKRAKAKRDQWLSKVATANKAWKKAYNGRIKELVSVWRKNARELHILRKDASTMMQKTWRRKSAELKLVKRYARVSRANTMFLVIAHLNYDLRRVRALRAWEREWRVSRRDRAATCITRTLLANGYSAKLNAVMEKILSVIKVIRRAAQRRMWPHWRERFLLRTKKHARVTLRFFLRGQLERIKEKKQAADLDFKADKVARLIANSTTYVFPLKREMFRRWREERQKKMVVMSRLKVAFWLPRAYARLKAKRIMNRKRVRLEVHLAFDKSSLYRRVGRYLAFWHSLSAMRHIQRCWRQRLARNAFRRRKYQVRRMKEMKYRRDIQTFTRKWFLWQKFCFLRRRARHRMARRITVFFKRVVRNRRIIWATRRKPRCYRLILTFHTIMLTRAFRKMSAGVTGLHTLMVLGPLFLSRWRQCVRLGFSIWRRKHVNQARMLQMIRILTTRKMDKLLWPGCGSQSVRIAPMITGTSDEYRYRQMLPKANIKMPWEGIVEVRDVKYRNERFFRQHRAFRAWMCCYRYRHRLKMSYDNDSGAHRVAEKNVFNSIRTMFKRAREVISIQCCWRIYVARKVRRAALHYTLRIEEIVFRLENKPRWKLVDWMIRRASRAREARLQIQCFYRQWKSRQASRARRAYLAFLAKCVQTINRNSKSARALLGKHMKKMVILFIYSMSGVHRVPLALDVIAGGLEWAIGLSPSSDESSSKNSPAVHSPENAVGSTNEFLPSLALAAAQSAVTPNPEALLMTSTSIHRRLLRHIAPNLYRAKGKSYSNGYTGLEDSKMNKSGRGTGTSTMGGTASWNRAKGSHLAKDPSLMSSHSGLNKAPSLGSIEPGALNNAQQTQLNALASNRIAAMTTHQSPDFHSHVYRLRQSGIFVFESSTEHSGLTLIEKEYLLQGARQTFCQNVTSEAIQQICVHFQGEKLAFCGGSIKTSDMLKVLRLVSVRTVPLALHFCDSMCSFHGVMAFLLCLGSGGEGGPRLAEVILESISRMSAAAQLGFLRSDSECMHVVDDNDVVSQGPYSGRNSNFPSKVVSKRAPGSKSSLNHPSRRSRAGGTLQSQYEPEDVIGEKAKSLLMDSSGGSPWSGHADEGVSTALQMLQAIPSPSLSSLSCLRELSVDSNSFGSLGIATILVNMKDNTSIETLIITFTQQALLPSLGKCIRAMAPNSSLRELRVFGAGLDFFAVQGILEAVTKGLRGLRHLEFTVRQEPDAARLAEKIIDVAKNRLYGGRLSLSVSVN